MGEEITVAAQNIETTVQTAVAAVEKRRLRKEGISDKGVAARGKTMKKNPLKRGKSHKGCTTPKKEYAVKDILRKKGMESWYCGVTRSGQPWRTSRK